MRWLQLLAVAKYTAYELVLERISAVSETLQLQRQSDGLCGVWPTMRSGIERVSTVLTRRPYSCWHSDGEAH